MAKMNQGKPRVFLTKPQRRKAEKLYYNLIERRGINPEKAFIIVMDSISRHEDNDRIPTIGSKPIGKNNRIGRR